jgi:cytochrome P450
MKRQVLRFTVHIPLDPASVQHVLLDNAANYVKPDVVKTLTGPMIGRGLLTSDDALWREQRKIVAASFAPAAVDALTPVFTRAAEEKAGEWSSGEIRDMAAESTRTTMEIIANTLFSGDERLKTAEAMAHIEAALNSTNDARVAAILGLPQIGWTKGMRRGQRGRNFLRSILATLVRERIAEPRDDFLGRLVSALQERFAPDEAFALALDNAATFYLAGHETTANAVTWTLAMLAEQPELQAEVAAEVEQGGSEMLRRVIEESMRLYPPVPRFDRQAVEPDRIGEWDVAPGDIVSIWPWLLHRHRALWDDADAFDADRFAPDARAAQHRFQYIPFGAGPRVCVGMRFAITEAVTVLSAWLRRWRFEPSGQTLYPLGTVTLRPEGGLKLLIRSQ